MKFQIKRGRGLVKEFNYNGELLFEGEYIDGKRNGKGKEYFNDGDILFEGEYKNGKRNGEGKEYYEEGKLYFEGKYLNDNRWNGKGYDFFGKEAFELKEGKGWVNEYKYCIHSLRDRLLIFLH